MALGPARHPQAAPGASGQRGGQAGGEEAVQEEALAQVLGWRILPEASGSCAQARRPLGD